MKTKEINGELYELVPEVKKGNCEGCVFKDVDRDICINLTDECYKGSIFKKVEKEVKSDTTSTFKPFNLEEAKAGKPVCTVDGRKARIICFDSEVVKDRPIIVLLWEDKDKGEVVRHYTEEGKSGENCHFLDLCMAPEKNKGYVILHKCLIYESKEEALKNAANSGEGFIRVQEVEWEE